MALTDKLTAIANAIRAKTGGTATMTLAEMPTEIASIETGITPSGSITLTEENTYDVTAKAQAVVDFSSTRADLAEAVTAKGVDTLPTASFDTIATNIGLIEGGGLAGFDVVKSGIVNTPSQTILTVEHNLGVVPDFIVLLPLSAIPTLTKVTVAMGYMSGDFAFGMYKVTSNSKPTLEYPANYFKNVTDSSFTVTDSVPLTWGIDFIWIVGKKTA